MNRNKFLIYLFLVLSNNFYNSISASSKSVIPIVEKEQIKSSIQIDNEFQNSFIIYDEFILDEAQNPIGSVYQFKVNSEQNIWIVDSKGCNIKQYNQQGKLLLQIGQKGEGPGEFLRPVALTLNSDKNLIVGDILARRISFLNQNGSFQRSFPIVDVRNIFLLTNDQLLIVFPEFDFAKKQGKCLHIYDSSGGKKQSFFSIPQNAFTFRMIIDGVAVCLDDDQNIYAAFSTDYVIYKFNKLGIEVQTFATQPDRYKSAPQELNIPLYSRKKLTKWLESWHRVFSLFCVNDFLVVSMITNEPSLYQLDIYSLDGTLLVGNIPTNYRLLASDFENKLYFLFEEELSGALQRKIIKAGIKIK